MKIVLNTYRETTIRNTVPYGSTTATENLLDVSGQILVEPENTDYFALAQEDCIVTDNRVLQFIHDWFCGMSKAEFAKRFPNVESWDGEAEVERDYTYKGRYVYSIMPL